MSHREYHPAQKVDRERNESMRLMTVVGQIQQEWERLRCHSNEGVLALEARNAALTINYYFGPDTYHNSSRPTAVEAAEDNLPEIVEKTADEPITTDSTSAPMVAIYAAKAEATLSDLLASLKTTHGKTTKIRLRYGDEVRIAFDVLVHQLNSTRHQFMNRNIDQEEVIEYMVKHLYEFWAKSNDKTELI